MTDITSILSASYKSNLLSTARRCNSRDVAVYPALYIRVVQIKNVVADAASGQTYLDTAYAIRSR
ncbi:hypothetical protein [Bradyrhizobium oligotrophicum]|uniref:hypothetical protein n=1 Tax=Bradyrhizobium oligotrophicum TaxID=44255 RepID=UPI003EBD4275